MPSCSPREQCTTASVTTRVDDPLNSNAQSVERLMHLIHNTVHFIRMVMLTIHTVFALRYRPGEDQGLH